jgi:hypothetical protein
MAYPEGVDLSKYSVSDYDWAAFVIVRLGSVMGDDYRRQQHVDFANAHGIPLGSYWFLYDSDIYSPEWQAERAYALQVGLGLELVPHFADCEGELSTETARRYIARMRALRGDCGIYSGWWCKSRGGPTLGADYGWLPEYHDTYTLPAQWSVSFTKLWQWTSTSGTLDRDRFLGTLDDMTTFFGGDMAAVDDMLDGMIAAENASVKADGTIGDPGLPPDTAPSQYYKRGWNRVRWNVNRLAGRDGADGATGATGPMGPMGPEGPAGPQGEPGATHDHTTVVVAGPATPNG